MKAKPLVPRERANRDIEEAIAWYLKENAPLAAVGFINAVEQAYRHVSRFPASGPMRYGHELNLPGLRFWPVRGYPWLVFYSERSDCIDIWRVLHRQRDIPAWMDESGQR